VQPHFGEEAAGTRGEVLALVMAPGQLVLVDVDGLTA